MQDATSDVLKDAVRRLLYYSVVTGKWYRRTDGKRMGSIGSKGYPQVYVCGRNRRAHKLAWVWVTGVWPTHYIDHVDRDPANGAWLNLREATPAQNAQNMALPKSNTSGYKGVCWNKAVSKWTAQISCGGKQINLGCYINKDDAIAAVRKAREELHGEFARHD